MYIHSLVIFATFIVLYKSGLGLDNILLVTACLGIVNQMAIGLMYNTHSAIIYLPAVLLVGRLVAFTMGYKTTMSNLMYVGIFIVASTILAMWFVDVPDALLMSDDLWDDPNLIPDHLYYPTSRLNEDPALRRGMSYNSNAPPTTTLHPMSKARPLPPLQYSPKLGKPGYGPEPVQYGMSMASNRPRPVYGPDPTYGPSQKETTQIYLPRVDKPIINNSPLTRNERRDGSITASGRINF